VFFMGSNAAELATTGEMDAIEQASIAKIAGYDSVGHHRQARSLSE
jgi:hypothetical protein